MKITKNKVVTFECVLKDGDGNILEDTKELGANTYLHGYGNLLPALEDALEGKEIGAKIKKHIPAEDAFGDYDDTLVVTFPIEEFGDDKPEIGQQILLPTDDEEDDSEEMIFEVIEIKDGKVTLDGNHPYADLDLDFDIKIVDIRDATPEEIERKDLDYGCDCDCDDCHDDDCDCGHCH